MIRSAINGVTPKRDLVGYRYQMHPNCDVREALNFFGTTNSRQFKFNLDLACKAFGVETSKSEGVDGRSVEPMYRAGRHREIADYCLEDVRATAELYEKLAPTLLIFNREFRDSEERDRRVRVPEEQVPLLPNFAAPAPLLPSSEASFMEAVARTSLTLTSSLDLVDEPSIDNVVMTARHQAVILDKLMPGDKPEDEIPTGI